MQSGQTQTDTLKLIAFSSICKCVKTSATLYDIGSTSTTRVVHDSSSQTFNGTLSFHILITSLALEILTESKDKTLHQKQLVKGVH